MPRTAVTALTSGTCWQRGGDRRWQRLERLVGDDVVGLDAALEDAAERVAQRRGEHGRRADERHADHQRRRRWPTCAAAPARRSRGPARPGVLNSLADRPADQLGDRPGDRGRHAGHAEEDEQRPERRPARACRWCHRVGRTGRRRTCRRRSPMTMTPTTSRRVLSASNPSSGRIAATGGILRRPPGRHDHRGQRDPDADEEGEQDRCAAAARCPCRGSRRRRR